MTTKDSATESYCPYTNVPLHECRCIYCRVDHSDPVREAPTTEPSIRIAAPVPEPEICKLAYYGLPCTNRHCFDRIHDRKRR
jgi:hypothetical protein